MGRSVEPMALALVQSGLRAAAKRRLTGRDTSKLRALFPSGGTNVQSRRGIAFFTRRRLAAAEKDANLQRTDPHRQAYYLKEANNAGSSAEVVRRFESQAFASNEECMREYIRALVNTNRLGGKDLRALINGAGVADGSAAAAMNPGMMAAGTVGRDAQDPLYVVMAQPDMKSRLWALARALALGFLAITAVSTLLENAVTGVSKSGKPESVTASDKRFDDVLGMDEAKEDLTEMVAFLKNPENFSRLGGKMPKGVLLTGAPGTGKTLLAKAVAGEAGVPFFAAAGSEFEEMYVGVGAKRIRELFKAAQEKAPAVIFIDEIDAIGSARNPKDQQFAKMTLNQLLVELDGFNQKEGVIVIAATNFPKILDPALTRPGRFDQHVHVAVPDMKGRKQILDHYLESVTVGEVDTNQLARGTPGFTGAKLANLVNLAAVRAASKGEDAVTQAQLEYAKDKILMGAERTSAVMTEKGRKLTAYHEGGHALVAHFTKGAYPIHKATIMPRGQALGMVMQLPENDVVSVTVEQMRAELDVCMGGRAAEEFVFGVDQVTSGASSDLQRATDVARRMVTQYGLSEKVGPVVYSDGDTLSGTTRVLIDSEVKQLLEDSKKRSMQLLVKHKWKLDKLAETLLDKETLSGSEIRELLGASPHALSTESKLF